MMRFGRHQRAGRGAGLERSPCGRLAGTSVAARTASSELTARGASCSSAMPARTAGSSRSCARSTTARSCVVEAEVSPQGTTQLVTPGPYTFADAHQASAFVTEAVAALMYLGCDIQAL